MSSSSHSTILMIDRNNGSIGISEEIDRVGYCRQVWEGVKAMAGRIAVKGEKRADSRVFDFGSAVIAIDGHSWLGQVDNLSESGAGLWFRYSDLPASLPSSRATVTVMTAGGTARFDAKIRWTERRFDRVMMGVRTAQKGALAVVVDCGM